MFHNRKDQDVYYMSEHSLSLLDEMFNPAHRKFGNEVEEAQHRQWPLTHIPPTSRMAMKSDRVRAPFQAQMPVTIFFLSTYHIPIFLMPPISRSLYPAWPP